VEVVFYQIFKTRYYHKLFLLGLGESKAFVNGQKVTILSPVVKACRKLIVMPSVRVSFPDLFAISLINNVGL